MFPVGGPGSATSLINTFPLRLRWRVEAFGLFKRSTGAHVHPDVISAIVNAAR